MCTFKSIEEARVYFEKDRFATENGMKLEVLNETESICSMTITERHQNANGGVMGGAIFTLADFAFAALANNLHMPTVAQQVSINYLSAPKGEKLTARAMCKKLGRSTMILNVDVTDDMGRDIAQFVGSGFLL
ncbi:MAG: PaaI family thioesterase [Lachnospiraceae bacterium]|nr:PaaI family thioesterase [Lachnospiraceae bacterium]